MAPYNRHPIYGTLRHPIIGYPCKAMSTLGSQNLRCQKVREVPDGVDGAPSQPRQRSVQSCPPAAVGMLRCAARVHGTGLACPVFYSGNLETGGGTLEKSKYLSSGAARSKESRSICCRGILMQICFKHAPQSSQNIKTDLADLRFPHSSDRDPVVGYIPEDVLAWLAP